MLESTLSTADTPEALTAVSRSGTPVEEPGRAGWLGRVARTLVGGIRAPGAAHVTFEEPVHHVRVIRYLGTLRLAPWLLLVLPLLVLTVVGQGVEQPYPILASFLAPALVTALRFWLVAMVPLGVLAGYFIPGLLIHVALVLTGGVRRSSGATMRAVGLTGALPLLVIGLLDLGMYWHAVGPDLWAVAVLAMLAWHLFAVTVALHRAHRVSVPRAALVAPAGLIVLYGFIALRATTVLPHLPFASQPEPEEEPPLEYLLESKLNAK